MQQNKSLLKKSLIYEWHKNKPLFYRGYNLVLSGRKSLEEVVGSSDVQSWIIDSILHFLHINLDYKEFKVLSNELGFIYANNRWYNLDIAIYERNKLKLTGKYTKIPPKVVIEVDTKADLSNFENPNDYFIEKTETLLGCGVERVLWVFSKTKRVLYADKFEWKFYKFSEDVKIMDDLYIKLSEAIKI
jgi:hypothetical protein